MIATLQSTPLDQWRQHLGGRQRRVQPRPIAALGYLTDHPAVDGLIAVENLILVLLFDEVIRARQCASRLAGLSGNRVPWGVRFGGRANCRFAKDLMLQPMHGGEGYRLDAADEELLALGLELDRDLDRHSRSNKPLRQRPALPKLWAGFDPHVAIGITGGGPELAAYALRVGKTPQCLMDQLRRDHQGLKLFPCAWVSHHWQQFAAIFADMTHFAKRQLIRLARRDDLAGFYDAAEFDFLSGAPQPSP